MLLSYKANEYIQSKKYMEGFKLIGDKRALNDLEIGILHHNLEANNKEGIEIKIKNGWLEEHPTNGGQSLDY